MHIVVLGMNHKTASVELRERVSLSEDALERLLQELRDSRTVMESVVLSTCNRTELYALVNSIRAGQDYLLTRFAGMAGLDKSLVESSTYFIQGEQAVAHAMRVASGLDSVVVGETQILGQMRTAFQTAFEAGNTGAMFNRLFREVIHVGKRAQAETTIGQSPVSVSYAAVQLASKFFGDMSNRKALVVGAGHMGELALVHLHALGVRHLVVANRTLERAQSLTETVSATVISLADVAGALAQFDVVISATGAPGYTIQALDVELAMKMRKHQSMVLLDIAMPRDIDPAVGALSGAYLYDVDDLDGVIEANLQERKRQAAVVESMIAESVDAFSKWLTEQEVVPLITALREKGLSIQQGVMDSLLRKLPDLTERDRKVLNKHTMSIVNQILRDPIQNVKELAMASGDAEYVSLFAQLFGIDESSLQSPGASVTGATAHFASEGTFVELFQRMRGEAKRLSEDKRVIHPVLR
ncbi:glutamyl-tRNA reductase [Alicyclobacillus fastidiosus]|uniref:Glutamyl-tRNA reductase n=1 Tax=Alicyclobacillus fastidiosus TaxID=392011 RepID=A0ABY6ZN16_9BACL|nr:glutamyl-tRNA reductase [Alicyclobacillus fastidiosus]WAH44236.1 glutamyl-tRNA reductase [Alicyclobacillus fastidiosus]GMA60556.1 glutamyl-tRNA reductase [Alicyclobacillus fastidiosus]